MHRSNDRSSDILRILVESYIHDGQPVGSKAIAQQLPFAVSSATVRNVMSDLEERGLIRSPHTSAGRIPTALGYRMFVDSLITWSPLEADNLTRVRRELSSDKTPKELVEHASRMLSELTSMACVVLAPKVDHSVLRQVEFLPLSGNRVLVILVLNDCDVQNRIINTQRTFSEDELEEASAFVNRRYAGQELFSVRERILADMREDKLRMDTLMSAALEVASQVISTTASQAPQCVVSGETNLLPIADEQGVDRVRDLFDAFQQKKNLLSLMDSCLRAEGVQVYIGQESGYQVLDDCSVVSAPYVVSEGVLGVLAVIGPTRMPYQRVVPMVDITAKILSAALNSSDPAP